MSGQLSMFSQTTCEATSSATSSLESEGGLTRSDSPGGLMTDQSGQDPAHVSRSRARGKGLAPPIRATFGRRGFGSSASAALTSSLVSRFQARTDGRGSILFALTWKVLTTPSGRSIAALRASALRTSGNDCGGWQTPRGQISGDTIESHEARQDRVVEKHGRRMGTPLEVQALFASWPTPTVNDAKGSDYSYSSGDHARPVLKLPGTAKLATLATPAARDWKSEQASETFQSERLAHPRGKALSVQACGAVGQPATGSPARTGKRGQLNPAFTRWLMGYPPAWDDCAVTAMQSFPKSRKRSSAVI
jgi:hypothetical protein